MDAEANFLQRDKSLRSEQPPKAGTPHDPAQAQPQGPGKLSKRARKREREAERKAEEARLAREAAMQSMSLVGASPGPSPLLAASSTVPPLSVPALEEEAFPVLQPSLGAVESPWLEVANRLDASGASSRAAARVPARGPSPILHQPDLALDVTTAKPSSQAVPPPEPPSLDPPAVALPRFAQLDPQGMGASLGLSPTWAAGCGEQGSSWADKAGKQLQGAQGSQSRATSWADMAGTPAAAAPGGLGA